MDGIERLNAACDAMWNDHGRLEENPGAFGQKYRIKEVHMRAISEAQQALPAALAAIKGTPDRGKMIRPAPDQSMCGGYPTGKVDDD